MQEPWAWCLRCRARRPLRDVERYPVRNTTVMRGTCVDCGGLAFKFVKREAAPMEMGVPQ